MGLHMKPLLGIISSLIAVSTLLGEAQISDRFYDVIRANDLAGLRSLVGQGATVNTRDRRGETPLQYATVVGSLDSMKLLIEAGADVNAQNDFGATALIWAATDLGPSRYDQAQ